MARRQPRPDPEDLDLDETGQVLAGLERLIEASSSPVVRVCLEEARDDIAHLLSTGEPHPEERASA